MQFKIFTTVGTSIITNDNNIGNFDDFDDSSYYENWESVKADFTTKSNQWLVKIKEKASQPNLSAEISSLLKIAESKPKDTFGVYLLCTDTLESAVCAWAIQQWFEFNKKDKKYTQFTIHFGFDEAYIVKDLRVTNQKDYEQGFMNLIEAIDNKKAKKGDILNITGGYKALIPILTLYGQLREMPLKYLYNEAELKDAVLVTVGNLPIGFDWAVIEALKPFVAQHFLDKPEMQKFGKNWYEEKEETDNTSPLYPVFRSLQQYGLILWNKDENKLTSNTLGKMVLKFQYAIEDNKGHIMEHLLFRYFCLPHKDALTKNYSSDTCIPIPPHDYLLDGKKIELGDIDIWLKYKEECTALECTETKEFNVWCEAKSISSATSYVPKDGKNKYYDQLKVRALALDLSYVETLFVIFRFVVEGVNDNNPFIHDALKPAIENLQRLNSDEDFIAKSSFKCLGISIPITFKENKVDMTESFYKGDFSKWKWELLSM